MQFLHLLRGLPGSGKSTLAREMASRTGWKHIESDDYFMSPAGEYVWQEALVPAAHQDCLDRTTKALKDGHSVIVANVFSKRSHFLPYVLLARDLGVVSVVIRCTGNWKSIHNVPDQTVERMRSMFEV